MQNFLIFTTIKFSNIFSPFRLTNISRKIFIGFISDALNPRSHLGRKSSLLDEDGKGRKSKKDKKKDKKTKPPQPKK